MGVVIGSAVIPLWNMMTWKKASGTGAIIAAWAGLLLGVTGWMVAAKIQSDEISVDTLGTNQVMLTGNLCSIGFSGLIHFIYSYFIDPQDYDFAELDKHIHLVEQDLSGLGAEQQVRMRECCVQRIVAVAVSLTRPYVSFVALFFLGSCGTPQGPRVDQASRIRVVDNPHYHLASSLRPGGSLSHRPTFPSGSSSPLPGDSELALSSPFSHSSKAAMKSLLSPVALSLGLLVERLSVSQKPRRGMWSPRQQLEKPLRRMAPSRKKRLLSKELPRPWRWTKKTKSMSKQSPD